MILSVSVSVSIEEKNQCVDGLFLLTRSHTHTDFLRRGGDSNPRYTFGVRQFSKLLVSATHPPLLKLKIPESIRGVKGNKKRGRAAKLMRFRVRR